jgi:hypothetical protein
MAKNDVVMTIGADTSQLDKAIETSEDAVKDLGKTGVTAVGVIDKATGGLATKFIELRSGIGQLIKGLNLTKVAIAATGVGALVIAFGALVSYFTQTKRGAEILERATASLGAVMGVLTDAVSSLGEKIFNAFSNPKQALVDFGNSIKTYVQDKIDGLLKTFGLLGSAIQKVFSGDFSGAMDDAKQAAKTFVMEATVIGDIVDVGQAVAESFSDIATNANEAARAANRLKQAEQALADSRRATQVETAKQRAEIKRLNLIAEDTTKSTEERIAAAQRAGEIERELFELRNAEAKEALRIRREQNALSESMAEDLQAEADLETEVYTLQAESLRLQTMLQSRLNTLKEEGLRLIEETRKAEEKAAKEKLDRENKMYDRLQQAQLDAANENLEIEKKLQEAKRAMIANTFTIIDSLNTLFTKDEEERAKKSFKIQKAAGISAATIATANAVADALAKDATFPGSRFLAAAAAGAAGAAQIATIARQQFQSAVSGIEEPTAPNLTQPSLAVAGVPSFQLPTQDAFRSYVLASDVNTAQQASQKVKDQALLLG